MTTYRRGDIVLVPFPFTDLSTIKQRPALIVSSTRFNVAQEDAIFVAITSNVGAYRKHRDVYHISASEQHKAGLPKEGIVRCNKITTIDQRLIRKTLGSLSRGTVDRVVDALMKIIR